MKVLYPRCYALIAVLKAERGSPLWGSYHLYRSKLLVLLLQADEQFDGVGIHLVCGEEDLGDLRNQGVGVEARKLFFLVTFGFFSSRFGQNLRF